MPPKDKSDKDLIARVTVIEAHLTEHLIEGGTIRTKIDFLVNGFKFMIAGLFSFTGSLLLAVIVYLLKSR